MKPTRPAEGNDKDQLKQMREYTIEQAKKVWLVSDTHFDHTAIIRYCHRPFKSVREMNATLIRNWNRVVAPDDLVYFVGDMSFGRHSRKAGYWLSRLNGRKVFIRGSHDRGIRRIGSILKIANREIIQVEGIAFLLIHDPFSPAVNGWDGWVVHGHIHNNMPFLGGKRINVCVEVTGYKPVSLYDILQGIKGV